MAKFTPGPAIGSASGSIGGTTFSRNRYGLYIRRRSIPTNPQSSAQIAIRNAVSNASANWRSLTAVQQAAWKAYAQANPIMDALGQSQVLAGNAAYVQLNARLSLFDSAMIDIPPIGAAPDALTSFEVEADLGVGAFQLKFGPSPVPANTKYVVRACIAQSPGINYVKNLYRVVTALTAAETTPYTEFETEIAEIFGTLQVGQVVHASASVLSLTTGLYSAPSLSSAVIVSTT